VVRAADEALQRLRDLGDLIRQGYQLGSPGYEPALMAYGDGLQALREAIRKDLGVEPLRIRVPLCIPGVSAAALPACRDPAWTREQLYRELGKRCRAARHPAMAQASDLGQ
jgi:hypothetical protein